MSALTQEDVLVDISSKVKTRPFYAGFLLKSVIVGTRPKPGVITIVATAYEQIQKPRDRHEYGPLVLTEEWISADQLTSWVGTFTASSKLKLAKDEEIDIKGSWSPMTSLLDMYLPSNYQYLNLDWPTNLYRYGLQLGQGNLPGEIPSPLKTPMFPTGIDAAEWWLGISNLATTDLIGKIVVALPNFRVRIRDVEIGSRILSFSVERARETEVVARLYIKDHRTGERSAQDLDVKSDKGRFEVGPEWTQLKLLIADKDTGETLDYRNVYASWTDLPKGVRRQAASEDLLEIIRRGEREEVEFKQSLTNSDDIVKTIVAFANTLGGILFLGVADDCQILGLTEDLNSAEQKIRNWVRYWCEQPVTIDIRREKVLEHEILAVFVKQSPARPCWVRGKGPFVRYGSNNRIASKSEVEQMLQKGTTWP